jgi:hypothetical protein
VRKQPRIVIRPRNNTLSEQQVRQILQHQLTFYLSKTGQKEYPFSLDELVRLARQESGFNPRAESNKGAAGLFQFMPGTAQGVAARLQNLGLIRINPSIVDAEWLKQHPVESALFAIHYLNEIYNKMSNRFRDPQTAKRATLLGYLAGPHNMRYIQRWVNDDHPYVDNILETGKASFTIKPQIATLPISDHTQPPIPKPSPRSSVVISATILALLGPIGEHLLWLLEGDKEDDEFGIG